MIDYGGASRYTRGSRHMCRVGRPRVSRATTPGDARVAATYEAQTCSISLPRVKEGKAG